MFDLNSKEFDSLPLVDTTEILKRVSDYQIYSFYISDEIDTNGAIHSPLRNDAVPSFSFWKHGSGKLVWRDFATGQYGDCFDFLRHKFGLSFRQALIKVVRDFNLPLSYEKDVKVPVLTRSVIQEDRVIAMPEKNKLSVRVQPFTNADKEYWSKYGIPSTMLKEYNVHSIGMVFSGDRIISRYKASNPIYGYLFFKDGEYTWKIYKPLEPSRQYKWMSNTNKSILQGWDQMPETGNLLIINKSLKDVMVMKLLGYNGVAMQSESQMIKPIVMEELQRRFVTVVILQDFDLAGVKNSNRHYKEYGIHPMFMQKWGQRGNGLKDISDYREKLGKSKATEKINELIRQIK